MLLLNGRPYVDECRSVRKVHFILPLNLKTVSVIPLLMMNINGKFHWNLSTKRRGSTSGENREIVVNWPTTAWRTDEWTDRRTDGLRYNQTTYCLLPPTVAVHGMEETGIICCTEIFVSRRLIFQFFVARHFSSDPNIFSVHMSHLRWLAPTHLSWTQSAAGARSQLNTAVQRVGVAKWRGGGAADRYGGGLGGVLSLLTANCKRNHRVHGYETTILVITSLVWAWFTAGVDRGSEAAI